MRQKRHKRQVFKMMQNKTEYEKIPFSSPRRCGKYRYLPREKRILKMEKMVNQNKADIRVSSFRHNFSRFPNKTTFQYSTLREENRKMHKLAFFQERGRKALAKVGIISCLSLTLSPEEEKEVNALLARLALLPTENSREPIREGICEETKKTPTC